MQDEIVDRLYDDANDALARNQAGSDGDDHLFMLLADFADG